MNDFQLDFGGDIRYDATSVRDVTGTLHLDTGDVLVPDVRHPVIRAWIHPGNVRPEGISLGVPVTTDPDDASLARKQGLKQNYVIWLGLHI